MYHTRRLEEVVREGDIFEHYNFIILLYSLFSQSGDSPDMEQAVSTMVAVVCMSKMEQEVAPQIRYKVGTCKSSTPAVVERCLGPNAWFQPELGTASCPELRAIYKISMRNTLHGQT